MEENVNIIIPKQWKFLNNYIYKTLIYYVKNNDAIPKNYETDLVFKKLGTLEKKL